MRPKTMPKLSYIERASSIFPDTLRTLLDLCRLCAHRTEQQVFERRKRVLRLGLRFSVLGFDLTMPKYFCDYCETFLTHDSAAGRTQHIRGWKHVQAFKQYYLNLYPQWATEQHQRVLAQHQQQQQQQQPQYIMQQGLLPPPPGSGAYGLPPPPPPGTGIVGLPPPPPPLAATTS